MKRIKKWLPFSIYIIGVLLLASGFLWARDIIPTAMPMYIGIGIIAISLFLKGSQAYYRSSERKK